MSTLLPRGFVSVAEATSIFEDALCSGTPEHPDVVRHRMEIDQGLRDGAARKRASVALWEAVDRDQLPAWAIGGIQKLRLPQDVVSNIPMLRETGGLRFLRPSSTAYKEISACFGINLSNVHIAFRSEPVRQAARRALRNRRAAENRLSAIPVGRPSSYSKFAPLIEKLIDDKKWKTTDQIKKLTHLLHRYGATPKLVSEDTVARVLKRLREERDDRKFLRPVRKQRKKGSR